MSLLMVNLRRFGFACLGVEDGVDLGGLFPVDASGEDLGVEFLQGGVVKDVGPIELFGELGSVVVLVVVFGEVLGAALGHVVVEGGAVVEGPFVLLAIV